MNSTIFYFFIYTDGTEAQIEEEEENLKTTYIISH